MTLDDIIEKAATQEQDARVFADDPPPDPPPTVETDVLLSQLYFPLFTVLAPAWKVSSSECDQLAGLHAPVLDKYFPDMALGVEVTAILGTVAILGPRFGTPPRGHPDNQGDPDHPDNQGVTIDQGAGNADLEQETVTV